MNLKRNPSRAALLIGVSLLSLQAAQAQTSKAAAMGPRVFQGAFVGMPPVAADQAQVVYYREKQGVQRKSAAHVYVDREFHTGLLAGGYTSFCLSPGSHTLGAYLNDAPAYHGKSTDLYQADLEGGKTYYLKVREDGNTFPLAVKRDDAVVELKATRLQTHALSRASAVEACRYFDYLKDETRFKHYTLAGDVLFPAGKWAKVDLSPLGLKAVDQLLADLQRDDAQLKQVQVTGHTDPQGDEAENQLLGERRANTVRQMLVEGGIAESILITQSAGSREPVVRTCYGSPLAQTTCYAPNRRVEIQVEVNRSEH